MVLEIRADAGQVVDDCDAVLLQLPGRADAGEHQKLRRVDRAAAQDDFAPRLDGADRIALPVFQAADAPALKQQAGRHCIGRDGEIGAPRRRLQIGVRGAPAPAPVNRHVHRPEAFLPVAVHIGGAGVAGLFARFDEGAV